MKTLNGKVLPRKKDPSEMSDVELFNNRICPRCRMSMSMYMHERDENGNLPPYCSRCDVYWTKFGYHGEHVCCNEGATKIRQDQFNGILARQKEEMEAQRRAAKQVIGTIGGRRVPMTPTITYRQFGD
jgi:hypothetical protein